MEESRLSPSLFRWIFYTRTSRIYSARGWSQLSWRLPFGYFSPLAGTKLFARHLFRNITVRTDINNVFCETHETDVQKLSSTCTGTTLCLITVHFWRWAVTVYCQISRWINLAWSCCGRKVDIWYVVEW